MLITVLLVYMLTQHVDVNASIYDVTHDQVHEGGRRSLTQGSAPIPFGNLTVDWKHFISTIPTIYNCHHIGEFVELMSLGVFRSCLNVDQVFDQLMAVANINLHCLNLVLDQLGHNFRHSNGTPDYCTCEGINRLINYQTGVNNGLMDQREHCMQYNGYKTIFDSFFSDHGNHPPVCRTHHSLWDPLRRIQQESSSSVCQRDVIYHLQYSFQHHTDPCHCEVDNCLNIPSFDHLVRLTNSRACISSNSIWGYINELWHTSESCFRKIQKHMTDVFLNQPGLISEQCECHITGKLTSQQIPVVNFGRLGMCYHAQGSSYRNFTEVLFTRAQNHGCTNQNYLWNTLSGIKDDGTDCTQDFIWRAVDAFPNPSSDPCVCTQKDRVTAAPTMTSGTIPSIDKQTVTLSPPSTPSSTPPSTTTTMRMTTKLATTYIPYIPKFHCGKLTVIGRVAESVHVDHPDATKCDQTANSNEALILTTCNTTSPATWTRGPKVMDNCARVPHYTPVATFKSSNVYTPVGSLSGVLIDCTATGFKLAVQPCFGVPTIIYIETRGNFTLDPHSYYVLE